MAGRSGPTSGQSDWQEVAKQAKEALKAGHLDDVIRLCNKALRRDPQTLEPLAMLAAALLDHKSAQESLVCSCQALALVPKNPGLHLLKAKALSRLGRHDEAASAFAAASKLEPDNQRTLFQLGLNYLEAARPAEALKPFQQAYKLDPKHKESGLGIALAALAIGDFATGWPAFEIRADFPEAEVADPNPERRWRGQQISGKLLLGSEQGHGDFLQFVRFATLARKLCGRLVVQAPTELKALAQTVAGIDAVIPTRPFPTEFEAYAPLLSVPGILKLDPLQEPWDAYLTADPKMVRNAAPLFAPLGSQRRIGISWAGNPRYSRDRQRSIPFPLFLDLLEVPEVALASLQHGPRSKDPQEEGVDALLLNLSKHLRTFMHTAALMSHLDLVICCDSAVAHLAGALGKEVWILLEKNASWRWTIESEKRRWYPKSRLFHQQNHDDWEEVMERVLRALVEKNELWREERERPYDIPENMPEKTESGSEAQSTPLAAEALTG